MKWTDVKPTRPGFWWFKNDEYVYATSIREALGFSGMKFLLVTGMTIDGRTESGNITKWIGQWSDAPIPEP